MRFEELGKSWREENAEGADPASREELLTRISRRVERFWHRIVWRDWRETLVAGAVMPIFMLKAWSINEPLLGRVGAALVVASLVSIVYRLHAVRLSRPRVADDAPVRDFYQAELARLEDQIHLLRSVLSWYVTPTFMGVGLMFIGQLGVSAIGFGMLAFLALMAWGLRAINQKAVRSELVPIRDEIMELLEQLDLDEESVT